LIIYILKEYSTPPAIFHSSGTLYIASFDKQDMMTAEGAAEAAKGLTFEKVWAMFQETDGCTFWCSPGRW
jgi:hypothetical protein